MKSRTLKPCSGASSDAATARVSDASNGAAAATALEMMSDRRSIRERAIDDLHRKEDVQPSGCARRSSPKRVVCRAIMGHQVSPETTVNLPARESTSLT